MRLHNLLRSVVPKGWTCMCGYINGDNRTTCGGCGQ